MLCCSWTAGREFPHAHPELWVAWTPCPEMRGQPGGSAAEPAGQRGTGQAEFCSPAGGLDLSTTLTNTLWLWKGLGIDQAFPAASLLERRSLALDSDCIADSENYATCLEPKSHAGPGRAPSCRPRVAGERPSLYQTTKLRLWEIVSLPEGSVPTCAAWRKQGGLPGALASLPEMPPSSPRGPLSGKSGSG